MRCFSLREFFVERDAGERKQDDSFRNQPEAPRREHVPALMSCHTRQNNADQSEIARAVGRP